MRQVTRALGMGAIILLAGCNNFPQLRGTSPPPAPVAQIPTEVPTAPSLVAYLNNNARLVQSMDCRELDIDAKQGGQSAGLRGWMVCQKPRNFRMGAKVIANPELDLGSNSDEFWYWIRRADPPYLFHCSYQDLARGVRMPFPFQPDWVMEALGMKDYESADGFRVEAKATTLHLVQETTSTQGQPVRKVTVFQRAPARYPRPQIVAHVLQDAAGKEICAAYISEVQRVGNAVVPRSVKLVWPAEKMEMKLVLDDVVLNDPSIQQRASRLFSRPKMSVRSYDLARGLDPQPGRVKRAGGIFRR